ncbi:hypothetical protein [Actinotalea subterranea]|uniref:hypothetical protein n=1 Tax=Actinotalea subterranea TaxID=2607497 RepID=UPI0011EEAD4A|nr:hypothetical protein [Actinotalea subterranea]
MSRALDPPDGSDPLAATTTPIPTRRPTHLEDPVHPDATEQPATEQPQPEALLPADDSERGDVPGWVLVTLMTAGLVLALWAIAGPALTSVFETAISRVTAFG